MRLDAEAERALRSIERLDKLSTSEAVRRALMEAQDRRFSDEAIREAATKMWEDPDYIAEVEDLLAHQDDPWETIPE